MHISSRLEVIVFLTGFVVMVLEIVGSRMLGPYVGTSIYVWTSLIGVVLGCLSLGYWWGGKLADNGPSESTLSRILLLSAVGVALTTLVHGRVTGFIVGLFPDVRISASLSAIILFGIPSVLLGMVSPYTVKLRMKTIIHSGETVGRLYAISTLGSIVGTFVSGFFLLSFMGSTNVTFLLAIILFITAVIARGSASRTDMFVFAAALGVSMSVSLYESAARRDRGIEEFDTQYNHVTIITGDDAHSGRTLRVMKINNENSSGIFPGSTELAFGYLRFYDMFEHFVPSAQDTLMIGGAGYTYATYYLDRHVEKRMDVVEIDPAMAELARTHFDLPVSDRLHIFHQDGRVFLNTTKKETYDVVLGDAYASFYTLPFQLTTVESTRLIYDALRDGGAAFINIIASIEGDTGKFLRAEYATFRSVFPYVYIFPVRVQDPGALQNVMLVALKTDIPPSFTSQDQYLQRMLSMRWTGEIADDVGVLVDDFAPVDRYMAKAVLTLE